MPYGARDGPAPPAGQTDRNASRFRRGKSQPNAYRRRLIMVEWTRTDLGDASDPTGYKARRNHLLTSSGGLNTTSLLNTSTVQKDASAIDTLFGDEDRDWFLASTEDATSDQASTEGAAEVRTQI